MSAPKFTPGEWRVGVKGHDADMLEDSGEWVPVLEGTEEDGGIVAWVHPAHAAKVAASPEMYAALERLLSATEGQSLDENMPAHGYDSSVDVEFNAAREQARNALGKAVPRG